MHIRHLAFAAVLTGLAMTAPAGATVITVTWTGTVLNGNDSANFFGVPLTGGIHDLAGQNFSTFYRIDSNIGSLVSGPGFYDLRDGLPFGLPSPVLGSSLTINGQTALFGSADFAAYSRENTPGRSNIYTEVNNTPGVPGAVDILFLAEFRFDQTIPFNLLTDPLSRAVGSTGRGVFQKFNSSGVGQFSGNFAPTFVTIAIEGAPPSGIPEPSTWAMVLSGIGLLAISRRRI